MGAALSEWAVLSMFSPCVSLGLWNICINRIQPAAYIVASLCSLPSRETGNKHKTVRVFSCSYYATVLFRVQAASRRMLLIISRCLLSASVTMTNPRLQPPNTCSVVPAPLGGRAAPVLDFSAVHRAWRRPLYAKSSEPSSVWQLRKPSVWVRSLSSWLHPEAWTLNQKIILGGSFRGQIVVICSRQTHREGPWLQNCNNHSKKPLFVLNKCWDSFVLLIFCLCPGCDALSLSFTTVASLLFFPVGLYLSLAVVILLFIPTLTFLSATKLSAGSQRARVVSYWPYVLEMEPLKSHSTAHRLFASNQCSV